MGPTQLKALAAVTVTGNTDPIIVGHHGGAIFQLRLTDAQTDAGDTLDVTVQATIDRTNWIDVVHFTQILGNGADSLLYVAKIAGGLAETMFETVAGAALSAGSVRHVLGVSYRVKWVIVDADLDATFTFGVYGLFLPPGR